MKTTVIHHSADYDGIFCREIARKFLPDAEFIGWDFKDAKLVFPSEGTVYVLDLSPDCFDRAAALIDNTRLIWIDHHKSSIEKWSAQIPGYRIDGVAACRLAWQWFLRAQGYECDPHQGQLPLPIKEQYVNRSVSEPLAVRLAGEYDIWDHRGDGDLEFQFGLDCWPDLPWKTLLEMGSGPTVNHILLMGRSAMACYAKRDADVMRERSFLCDFEGLKFLALNTARCNSNTFAARDVPETGHDGLMAFYYNGDCWTFSLYHAAHRKDLDLSVIAVKHGGGGHRGACGFRSKGLPFKTKFEL